MNGIETSVEIPVIGSGAKASLEYEFLKSYPKKTIGQLVNGETDGHCVVSGNVVGICEGEDWWYSACKCHKSVISDSGSYYCNSCARHVFHVIPR